MSTVAKFAELRAKTDRELVAIIGNEIERGLNLARARAGLGIAEHHRDRAEQAYHSVRKLLPSVDDRQERLRLEAELQTLSEMLDDASGPAEARARSAAG